MDDVSEAEQDLDVALTTNAGMLTERDFVLMLISLYRDCHVLWKVKSNNYMDKNKRSIALKDITKSLQIYNPTYTEDQLKKKINILRTNFNKEKNKIDKAKRSGTSDNNIPQPTLWYYKEMLFLTEQSDTRCNQMLTSQQKETQAKIIRKTPNNLKYVKRPHSEAGVIAKGWATKLSRLSDDQMLYAEKIIHDVLIEGEMGKLTRNGVQFLTASTSSNTVKQSP